jgi:arylsulfatase A-like enzyme
MKRPNIILIVSDQHQRNVLGCYGNSVIKTPRLDRMASDGMVMDNAYINNPVCTASRSSILTGRYPRAHGVTCTGIPLPDHELTLAHLLGEAGYDTAAIGKMHLTPTLSDPERYVESKKMDEAGKAFFRQWNGPYQGFNWVNLSIGHATDSNRAHYYNWLEDRHPDAMKHFEQAVDNALEPPDGTWFGALKWGLPKEAHSTVWAAETACEYMEQRVASCDEKPFFMWIGIQDPHPPFACPAPYCHMYDPTDMPKSIEPPDDWGIYPPHLEDVYNGVFGKSDKRPPQPVKNAKGQTWSKTYSQVTEDHAGKIKAQYYGMVSMLDEQIGRVLDKLDELNLAEDTIVIYTTDHGEGLGDHGLWLKGPYHYDSVIRAPMIWKYPRRIQPGRSSGLFNHVDIVPTLLEYAGVTPHPGVQGLSQAAVLGGEQAKVREKALCEYRVRDINGPGTQINMKTIVTDHYKLTYYGTAEYGELYDRERDSQELVNLWNEERAWETRESLLHELWAELVATEDPLPLRICQF